VFKDVSQLVDQQGGMIDAIDSNIMCASHNVERGVAELREASRLQSRSFIGSIISGIANLFTSSPSPSTYSNTACQPPIYNSNAIINNTSTGYVRELDKFISMQQVTGCWKLEEIAEYLKNVITLDKLKSVIPTGINEDQWATIIALHILNLKFKADSDEWDLLASKARKWLLTSLNDKIISDATTLAKTLITTL